MGSLIKHTGTSKSWCGWIIQKMRWLVTLSIAFQAHYLQKNIFDGKNLSYILYFKTGSHHWWDKWIKNLCMLALEGFIAWSKVRRDAVASTSHLPELFYMFLFLSHLLHFSTDGKLRIHGVNMPQWPKESCWKQSKQIFRLEWHCVAILSS